MSLLEKANVVKCFHAKTLQEALKFAEHGIYVVPLHAPLFNDAGACVGCTCEAYKRSQKYKAWLDSKGRGHKFDPAFKCRTPGKHPRLSDWETEASKDPAQICKWFARWPQLNLGIAAGRSGLLVLDADAYKENYAGADLLTQDDQQTATMITGNRGQHLYYQMPEGAQYGNETGELPEGIDIRGHGGMVVVYPSIHPNGNRYEWEDGYSLAECPPIPLPAALVAILDDAQSKSAPAKVVTFTSPSTEPPQLDQWHLSKTITDLIFNPQPVGKRSEADIRVAISLVYADATDDNILAVFEHYPIGKDGKFAEAGLGYLALTIGKARAFVEAHPRPDVPATVAPLRLWARTNSFEPYISDAFKTKRTNRETGDTQLIYITDATDTKVCDAVLDAMLEANRLEITIGKKRLGKLAGVSCNTALTALGRLNGWLFNVTPDKFGARVALVEKCRLQSIDPSLTVVPSVKTGDQSSENDKMVNEYSPRKADDPFLIGTSRHVKQQMANAGAARGISAKDAKELFTFPALGEGGLRVLDALLRAGDMTAQELAEETGKKLSAIRTACGCLVKRGLLDATRAGSRGPKVYGVADNVWARLETLVPHLRTYKLSAEREERRLVAAVQWVQVALRTAQPEEKPKLERRIAKLSAQRIPHLAQLHDDLPEPEVNYMAYDVTTPFGPHPAIQAKFERLHRTARIDIAEAKRAAEWELIKQVQQLRAEGDGKKEAVRKMGFAGYTQQEVWTAVQQVWRVARDAR